jgi:hypothetical protein
MSQLLSINRLYVVSGHLMAAYLDCVHGVALARSPINPQDWGDYKVLLSRKIHVNYCLLLQFFGRRLLWLRDPRTCMRPWSIRWAAEVTNGSIN